jgi:hypothetical protein
MNHNQITVHLLDNYEKPWKQLHTYKKVYLCT